MKIEKAMLELSENTIYRADQRLFVTHSDHNLIEIVGEDVTFLEVIIQGVQSGRSIEAITDKLYNDFQIQEDYATQLIDWLADSGILKRNQQPEIGHTEQSAFVFAPMLALDQKKQICSTVSNEQLTILQSASIEEATIILFISPLFDYLSDFEKVNRAAYEAGIPSIHFGADLHTFTVGPLCIPGQQTPCLHCYAKRKLVNLRNLNQTLQFIHHSNREVVHRNVSINHAAFQLGLIHLRQELGRILQTKYIRSALTATSIIYDTTRHEVQASRILKMPFCPVCSKRTPFYAPFNG